jgi:hypothetical protein
MSNAQFTKWVPPILDCLGGNFSRYRFYRTGKAQNNKMIRGQLGLPEKHMPQLTWYAYR